MDGDRVVQDLTLHHLDFGRRARRQLSDRAQHFEAANHPAEGGVAEPSRPGPPSPVFSTRLSPKLKKNSELAVPGSRRAQARTPRSFTRVVGRLVADGRERGFGLGVTLVAGEHEEAAEPAWDDVEGGAGLVRVAR